MKISLHLKLIEQKISPMKSVRIDVELEIESADKMSGQTLFDRQHNGFTGDLLPGNAVPFCTDARNSIVQMTSVYAHSGLRPPPGKRWRWPA